MSLINDALKRAKHAQHQNPPPAGGPPLKPAEPAANKSGSGAKSLLYIMVACVIVGNALLFFAVKDRSAKKATVPVTPVAATVPPAAPPTPATAPATAAPVIQPATSVAPTPAPAVAAAMPAVTETNPATAPVVAVLPEPPKPAPLKLQSIIYNPSRPSAMISGKFLLIGDRVQGFRVTAIDQETVTLVSNGQTNVLSLP